MYLFILYLFILFVIATGHIYTPLWSTWRFEGFQSQLGDSDASLFCFLSTEILWIRGFLNVEIVEVVSPQQRHEPLCVSDTVTSSVGIMNKQFQSKYPGRVFVSPWVDKRNVLLEHHARGFCCNFLHIVVTSASSWKPYSFILQLSAVPLTHTNDEHSAGGSSHSCGRDDTEFSRLDPEAHSPSALQPWNTHRHTHTVTSHHLQRLTLNTTTFVSFFYPKLQTLLWNVRMFTM